MRKTAVTLVALLFATHPAIAAEKVKQDDLQVIHALSADFAEVRENLEIAISGQGLVVNYVAHVASMLERTGRDLGANEKLYQQAEVFEFCSATLSREMMAADPHHIAICPYTIQIYVLPDQPGKVYIGYRRPPPVGNEKSLTALKKVEALLAAIVAETID